MPWLKFEGLTIEVDERGFLKDPLKWNEEIAKAFAKMEGVNQLTEDHWKVIYYLREYYLSHGICPPIKSLVKEVGFSLKRIWELFPNGPAKSACKWAGIPKPTGCG